MARIDYLNDQITRAERLARMVADELTVSRLLAFAAECRTELTASQSRDEFATTEFQLA